MEGLAKYRSSPLYGSVYIAMRVAGYGHVYMAVCVARYSYAQCPTIYTTILVHKSEKHSFLVTNPI